LHKPTTGDAEQHTTIDSDWTYADNKSGDIIFQIKNAYIIANLKSGLLFIDQQAAHQRILFERFMEEMTMSTEGSQQLLYAQTIRFSPVDTDIIKELLQDLRSMGFQISEFGRNTFLVEGVPAGLKIDDINQFLEHVLEDYRKGADLTGDKKRRLARSMAIHASIKPGRPLTVEEMNNLIDELFACKVPDLSPDQARIFFILHYQEIEKRLKNQTNSIHE
jgi:DNA mismatch repair protein MutL